MPKRSMLARAFGLGRRDEPMDDVYGPMQPAEGTHIPDIEAIFDAIRLGEAPNDTDELTGDTAVADLLLLELDRLWQDRPRLQH